MESKYARHWHGTEANGVIQGADSSYPTDYMRACSVSDYLGKIDVGAGYALILGDMPLQTMIRHHSYEFPEIVRVYYAEPDADVIEIMDQRPRLDFSDPAETMTFEVSSGRLIIFDSARSGDDSERARLSFELPPGPYLVLTKPFNLDEKTSVLIHKFSSRH
jgi:hypothetical protein